MLKLLYARLTNFEMTFRQSFRLYSQRLNVFMTLIVLPYIIATNGGFLSELVSALPEAYRVVLAPLAGFAAFALVTWARLFVQPNKDSNNGL